MTPATHMMFSFALTYGVPMGLAWRELQQLKKLRPPRRDDDGPEAPPEIWPRDGGRPLPACLIPTLAGPVAAPQKQRAREPA